MTAESANLSMWINGLVLSGLGAGAVLSVRERLKKKQWRSAGAKTTLPSPLSQAVARLVGTAGGIYLSLELLFSFLGLRHETWQAYMPLAIDPMAAFSLVIAIIQPYGVKVWEFARRSVAARSSARSVVKASRVRSNTKSKKRRL
ncbi:MAG: hypothetical protein FWF88_03055 [Peptococcaceae bacterium]|nr:hypothetical protein [Peptococcaceae bacterium]